MTTVTTAGPNGIPVIVPHYLGIEAREIESACSMLQIPAADREAVLSGVQLMANVAAPILNKRVRR